METIVPHSSHHLIHTPEYWHVTDEELSLLQALNFAFSTQFHETRNDEYANKNRKNATSGDGKVVYIPSESRRRGLK